MITNYIETGVDIGDDLTGFMPSCEALGTNPEKFPNWFVDQSICGVGGLWSWGSNGNGQLGDGTVVSKSSPIQIGTLTNWKTCIAYSAIKTDGTLWAWGENSWGHLGLGDTVQRSTPVQVGNLTNWKSITSTTNYMDGNQSTNAIKTDGTLWSWGGNTNGQLGLGDLDPRSSPVQVGSLTTWKTCSGYSAIKTDGTLWSWGDNTHGTLGLGDIVHRSSPVQVGSLTNWKSISSNNYVTLATKTDGTLWAWGWGDSLQIGVGAGLSYSSPIQIGSLTNWNIISEGQGSSYAIKTDGTLWAWGNNGRGQLGLGDTIIRSSPVQVGTLTDWKFCSGNGTTVDSLHIIKTDGTLWSCGANFNGQLGLGDLVHRSSPVQVGSLNTWKSVSGGLTHTTAIK